MSVFKSFLTNLLFGKEHKDTCADTAKQLINENEKLHEEIRQLKKELDSVKGRLQESDKRRFEMQQQLNQTTGEPR